MQRDDVLIEQPPKAATSARSGPSSTAVADRHVDRPRRRRRWTVLGRRAPRADFRLEPAGVDVAADRSRRSPCSSRQRRRAGSRPHSSAQSRRERDCARCVDVGIDALRKLGHAAPSRLRPRPARDPREAVHRRRPRASSAVSSFWWMSSNPPFDMMTTRSPSRALRGDGLDDVVDCRDVAGVDAGGLQVGDQLLDRQPLLLRQRRAEHRPAGPRVSAPARARAKSDWKIRRHDVADRGSKIAQMRRFGNAVRTPASVSSIAVG